MIKIFHGLATVTTGCQLHTVGAFIASTPIETVMIKSALQIGQILTQADVLALRDSHLEWSLSSKVTVTDVIIGRTATQVVAPKQWSVYMASYLKALHSLSNSKGYSLVEVIVSLTVFGFFSLGVIAVFGHVDTLSAKMKRKLEDQNTMRTVRLALTNSTLCKSTFENADLNSNEVIRNDLRIATTGTQMLGNLDPNFKSAILKTNDKVELYNGSGTYAVNLQFERKEASDLPYEITLFVKADASQRILDCSSVMNADSGASNDCGADEKGKTRFLNPAQTNSLTGYPVVCDGNGNWIAIQVNGGMFSRRTHDGITTCTAVNPLTGGCTCPRHYKGMNINGIATGRGDCSKADGITDHWYVPVTDRMVEVSNRSEDCHQGQTACIPNIP